MKTKCATCGATPLSVFLMCDIVEGTWCGPCFDETPCGKEEHSEGCCTTCWDDEAEPVED